MQLSYIEGWHAIAEANRIFGFDGWTRETAEMVIVREEEVGDKWRVAYRAKVRVYVNGIHRDGSGYGSGIAKDLGDAHEGALKEAETDATKRALMTFGNQFGLALYDKEQANVEDTSKKDAANKFIESLLGQIEDAGSREAIDDILNREQAKIERIKTGYPDIYADFERIISSHNERHVP